MFVVDTNILVYASNQDAIEHKICRGFLERCREQPGPWFTTWPILYEFLRVVTHSRALERPYTLAQAWQFVEAVLALPTLRLLTPTPQHGQVAAHLFNQMPDLRGSILHNAHTVILMREHGLRRIYTRDRDFSRFADLDVRYPSVQVV